MPGDGCRSVLGAKHSVVDDFDFETPLGIRVKGVTIEQWPRVVLFTYCHNDSVATMELIDPRPIESVVSAMDCYQIRVRDLNRRGCQLEFGKYEIEFWDEDNPIGIVAADAYTARTLPP